jgi:hypothetical protein
MLTYAGPAAAPSQVVDMGIAEFVARLQPGCSLPPLLYTPHEHYYMQVRAVTCHVAHMAGAVLCCAVLCCAVLCCAVLHVVLVVPDRGSLPPLLYMPHEHYCMQVGEVAHSIASLQLLGRCLVLCCAFCNRSCTHHIITATCRRVRYCLYCACCVVAAYLLVGEAALVLGSLPLFVVLITSGCS